VTKNILDGRKDRGKTVYPFSPFGERGYKNTQTITKMNDNINMDSTIAGSMNAHTYPQHCCSAKIMALKINE
jgi:hypothetical protein